MTGLAIMRVGLMVEHWQMESEKAVSSGLLIMTDSEKVE